MVLESDFQAVWLAEIEFCGARDYVSLNLKKNRHGFMLGFNINNLFKEFLLIITIYFLKTIFYVIVYLYVYFILTLYLSNKKILL